MAQDRSRRLGQTDIGAVARGEQGVLAVRAPTDQTGTGIADKPSVLILESVSDAGVVVTNYLWVDDTGDLRIATAFPTNQNGDGAVVGGQS